MLASANVVLANPRPSHGSLFLASFIAQMPINWRFFAPVVVIFSCAAFSRWYLRRCRCTTHPSYLLSLVDRRSGYLQQHDNSRPQTSETPSTSSDILCHLPFQGFSCWIRSGDAIDNTHSRARMSRIHCREFFTPRLNLILSLTVTFSEFCCAI